MDKRVDSTKKSVGLSPATWTDLPVESAIKMWSSDLKRLVGSDAESDAWVIAGQAVAIEANDADDVRELMHQIPLNGSNRYQTQSLQSFIWSLAFGKETVFTSLMKMRPSPFLMRMSALYLESN